jgi:hypothetical protein
MTRARDVSRLVTTPPNIYATDSEASAGFLSLSSASTIYQTKATNAMTLINTTSFNTTNLVELDNVFNSNYHNYLIYINIEASQGSNTTIRYRTGGVANGNNSYVGHNIQINTAGAVSNIQSGTLTVAHLGQNDGAGAFYELLVGNPNLSKRTFSTARQSAGNVLTLSSSLFDATTVFDGIQFQINAGTMTGTLSLYGINK